MLAARTLLPPQDENAGAATAVLQNKENAVAFGQARGGLGGNGKAGALAPQPTAPQASVRKALGNITNTAVKRVDGLASSSKPGAGAGGAGSKTEGRRAFGDITNSVKPQQQPGGGDTLKRRLQPIGQQPLQQAQQEPQPQHAGPSAPSLAQCASRAEQYAAEYGVERLAGKSAKEQEVERLAREEAGIEMRVRQLTSALGQWQVGAAGGAPQCMRHSCCCHYLLLLIPRGTTASTSAWDPRCRAPCTHNG